jgi:hypothetical protein
MKGPSGPFGTQSGGQDVPMNTRSTQRGTINAAVGRNVARKAALAQPVQENPYLSGWNDPTHRALLNLDDTDHGT